MKALFELFRRFDARRIFGFIRRFLGMSRPKVKCYDLLSNHALRVEGDSLQNAGRSRPNHNFYPCPPGGGRPCPFDIYIMLLWCYNIKRFFKKILIFGETPDILYLFGFPPNTSPPSGGVELIVPYF